MTEYRPTSTVGRTGGALTADIIGGPAALSDDAMTTYASFRPRRVAATPTGYDEVGSNSYFDQLAPVTSAEIRLLVEPRISNADIQLFVNNTQDTSNALLVNSLASAGLMPPLGQATWVTTGPISPTAPGPASTDNWSAFEDPFYIGINNQTLPTSGDAPDFLVYELILIIDEGGVLTKAPMCRRYPETPAIRSGVIFPKPRTLQQSARRGPGTAY